MLNSKKQGFALIYVIMLFAVISILALGVVALSVHNTQMTKNEITQQQAYYTSKTALDSFLSAAESADNELSTVELLRKIAPNAGVNATINASQNINSKMGSVSITLSCDSSTDDSICTKAKVISEGIYKDAEATTIGYINAKLGESLELFFATEEQITDTKLMPWPIVNGVQINPTTLPVYSKRFNDLSTSKSKAAIEKTLKDNFGDYKNYRNSCVFNRTTNLPPTNPVYNSSSCTFNYLDQDKSAGYFYFDTRVEELAVYVGSTNFDLEMRWQQGINFHPDSKHKVYFIFDDRTARMNFVPRFNIETMPNNGGPGVVFVFLGELKKQGSAEPVVSISLMNERTNAYFFLPYISTSANMKTTLKGGILSKNQTKRMSQVTIEGTPFDGLAAELYNYVVSESGTSSGGSKVEIEVSYE